MITNTNFRILSSLQHKLLVMLGQKVKVISQPININLFEFLGMWLKMNSFSSKRKIGGFFDLLINLLIVPGLSQVVQHQR